MSKRGKGKKNVDPQEADTDHALPSWVTGSLKESPAEVEAKDQVWLPEHAATHLQIGLTMLRELVRDPQHPLPCMWIGRARPVMRFRPKDVRAWEDERVKLGLMATDQQPSK